MDTEDDKIGRVIEKVKFLFIDLTQVRCQKPTDLLVRDIAKVFVQYDTNNDALVQFDEFDLIRNKLGLAPFPSEVVIPVSLDLEEFTEYAVAYLINSQGELDMDKLIENDSEQPQVSFGTLDSSTGSTMLINTKDNEKESGSTGEGGGITVSEKDSVLSTDLNNITTGE